MITTFLFLFLFCMRETGYHLNGRHDPLDFLNVRKLTIEAREKKMGVNHGNSSCYMVNKKSILIQGIEREKKCLWENDRELIGGP